MVRYQIRVLRADVRHDFLAEVRAYDRFESEICRVRQPVASSSGISEPVYAHRRVAGYAEFLEFTSQALADTEGKYDRN